MTESAITKVQSMVRVIALTTTMFACAGSGATAPPKQPPPPAQGGMGRSLQSEGTASISTVEADDVRGIPVKQVEQLLEGRVAGVQLMQRPGGGFSVQIRGPGSINLSNEPLYVIDGVPVFVARGRGVDWLNPGDIQRIEILKDASATSMYGMRGANGVVVITTKRGQRQ